MSISPEEAPIEEYGGEDINPPDRSRKTQSGSIQALPEEFAVGADCESRIRSGAEEGPRWGLQRQKCRSKKVIAIRNASRKISSSEIQIRPVCQLLCYYTIEYSW